MKAAAEGPMKGVLDYRGASSSRTTTSATRSPASFDATMTQVIGGNFAKIFSWYDNEWGFSNRMVDLVKLVSKKGFGKESAA
jgi:glyceraldehyde 3-phosphate dehydrogenase